jgi:hypothetical protein
MSVTLHPRAQIVDRLVQPLQHRTDGHGIGRALDRFVEVVAGIEVREDKDRGLAGRIVSPVECTAPETMPSARPVSTIRVPK